MEQPPLVVFEGTERQEVLRKLNLLLTNLRQPRYSPYAEVPHSSHRAGADKAGSRTKLAVVPKP